MKKILDENQFCGEWLLYKNDEVFSALTSEQRVFVTDEGLQIEPGADKELLKKYFYNILIGL